ncbi:T9SS type A sorting domain-containing protein [Spirosoma sp. KNUC1025]|uniref:T9SS type A sorting domain-containing protein n=1 Tax=Spirosoma sp. KNUC1025 TaxID=2894082 RepID=UPI00386FC41F|nr:T9SS type A sorting domain-containing protein [Spirosoma sp. KNUC1025]
MVKVYKTSLLLFLGVVIKGFGQTTYFQQNFSAGGAPASYVSSSPNDSQFNGLAGLSATVTNNAVQFTRPTDSGTGYISRSTNFAGPPTSLYAQFSFEVVSHDPTVSSTSAVIFYLGSAFNAGPQNPAVGDTYARIAFNLSTTTSGQFLVHTLPSGGGGTNSAAFSGRQTITFAMNNTGSNFNYLAPDGSLESLPNDTYDVWVGLTKVFNDQAVLTPTQTISNFKFRINNGVGVVQIGDLLMRDINGVLPVTLLSFTAKPTGDRVQLAWSTSMERDADHFVVERSRDLGEYVTVGEVVARGNTDERQNYGMTDMNPLLGVNYYRLRQIDHDGTTHSFKPVSAIIRPEQLTVVAYPNPASSSHIHLQLWNADNAVIRLLSPLGIPVSCRIERQSGSADLFFDKPLPSGFYWIEAQTESQRQTVKVLVHE